MALMWPRQLPKYVTSNLLRSTECEVYKRLEKCLDDTFTVFYSRPWLGLKPDGEEIDGECDFVIAHPELGILAIEVKGGGISYDPRLDQWISQDRWKIKHKIKNPVGQARTSKYQLLEKLQSHPMWTPRRVRIRHGVIFPDAIRPKSDLGPDMPLKLFCFSDVFDNGLHAWVLDRFGDQVEKTLRELPLGQDGIRALEDLLAHPFHLNVPLGRILDDDDKDIQILTTQQYHILRSIECVPRAAIAGGAGTGKTVLAMEEARRCAVNGLRTLFTCFSSPLAGEIKRRISSDGNPEVSTFHDLCLRIISGAGISLPSGISDTVLFRDVCPELFIEALCAHNYQGYDAIIVDEGQDFYASWWPAIDCLMDPKGGGIIRVFYDSNQRVYENVMKLPVDVQLIPIRLTMNLRNTRRIHAVTQNYYEGHLIESLGPEGTTVEWIKCKTAEAVISTIGVIIGRLVVQECIPVRDIAILTGNETLIEKAGWSRFIAGHPTTNCSRPQDNAITVDTIRRFKGLESKVVILVVTKEIVSNTEMLYVATSRARDHLIIVGIEIEKIPH